VVELVVGGVGGRAEGLDVGLGVEGGGVGREGKGLAIEGVVTGGVLEEGGVILGEEGGMGVGELLESDGVVVVSADVGEGGSADERVVLGVTGVLLLLVLLVLVLVLLVLLLLVVVVELGRPVVGEVYVWLVQFLEKGEFWCTGEGY
jgi:hypothetical protein